MRASTVVLSVLLLQASSLSGQQLNWPVSWPRVTQDYACKKCTDEPERNPFHAGIDVTDAVVDCNTSSVPVHTAAPGYVRRTVIGCGTSAGQNGSAKCGRYFGNHMIIEHRPPQDPEGPLYSAYAHLASLNSSLGLGDHVPAGTEIGVMGATGAAEACHLHFQVLTFEPGNLGHFDESNLATSLETAGFFGYTTTYPVSNCGAQVSNSCPDPKTFMVLAPSQFSQSARVLERPESDSACVTQTAAEQGYVSVAQREGWYYIVLPSDLGPIVGEAGDTSCNTQATYGWIDGFLAGGFTPVSGFRLQVRGEALAGAGAPVRALDPVTGQPSTAAEPLTRVWSNQQLWATGEFLPSSVGCDELWYEIDVPPQRTDGHIAKGWVCGDDLIIFGGQCQVPSLVDGVYTLDLSCTPGQPPSVTTLAADQVTQQSAAVMAAVNPNGLDTSVWFEWGSSTALGFSTPRESAGAGTSSMTVSMTLSNLDCGRSYFFRGAAENSAGSNRGSISSFTTAGCSTGGEETETRELLFNGGFEQGENFW